MAETTIRFFNTGLDALFTGGINLSKTFRCALLSDGYSLNLDAASFSADISAYVCGNASGGAAIRKVGGGLVTSSSRGVLAWDLTDVALTATAGEIMCARYAILLQSGVDIPVAVFEISASEAVARIFNIQWPD
jgi:hypothetical protein